MVIGSGPSLQGFRFSELNDSRFCTFAINEEGWKHEDEYQPDFWIFHDDAPGMGKIRNSFKSPKTKVILRREVFLQISVKNPTWADGAYGFTPRRNARWEFTDSWLPMGMTTAVPAVAAAAKMGFKKIILLGVDCYGSSERYYYDNHPKLASPVVREFEHGYITKQHEGMLESFNVLSDGLVRFGWDGEIIQTSLKSPLDRFRKARWQDAVNG